MTDLPTIVVLDIDGTLIDSIDVHHPALLRCFATYQLDITRPWDGFAEYSDTAVFEELIRDRHGRPATEDDFAWLDAELAREITDELAGRTFPPIAGAADLLAELDEREDISVVFATGSSRRAAHLKLESLGIDPGVAVVATSTERRRRQDIVNLAIEGAGLPAGSPVGGVSIGDGIWDEKTAVRLDLGFVGIESGTHRFGPIGDLIVPDLTSLDAKTLVEIASRHIVRTPSPAPKGTQHP